MYIKEDVRPRDSNIVPQTTKWATKMT